MGRARTKKRQEAEVAEPARPPLPDELPADPRTASRRAGALVLLYAAIAAYLVPIFPHGGSSSEETRWVTTASLVEHRSFEISWTLPLLGPLVDTARVGDRLYSNKAPSTALAALPAYLAVRPFIGPPDATNIRISWTAMRWLVSTIPLLLLGIVLQRRGASPFVVGVVLFGTPLFVYGLLLFSHLLAATALFGTYRLLHGKPGAPSRRDCLIAGLLAGLAVSAELPLALPVLILGSGLLFARSIPWGERLKPALLFCLGGLPFAIGLGLYNDALFGSPFSPSYAHESFPEWAELAERDFFGIGWPKPKSLWLLLGSPSRGLFFCAPVLLLSLLPLFRSSPTVRSRVRAAVVIAGLLLISGYGTPEGGWCAGPRYLVFLVPFLLEALLEARADGSRPVDGLLLGASIVLSTLPMLTFPFAPPELRSPYPGFWRPLLLTEGWATPTLGALIGLGSGLGALLPVIVLLLAALFLSIGPHPRAIAGACVGALAATLYVSLPGVDEAESSFRRATIAERFFKPTGRLDRLALATRNPADQRRLAAMRREVANVATRAPSNWPYSTAPLAKVSPADLEARVVALQKEGKLAEAERVLREGREELPTLRCETTDDLAVVLYQQGRKDEALAELESVRPLAAPGPCLKVLFRLGSLYQEAGRQAEALVAFEEFVQMSAGDPDPETGGFRGSAARSIAASRSRR